jgi:hypothetical protein
MLFGTYILSVKNPKHNKILLLFYFMPTFVGSLLIFIFYQGLILPISYLKVCGHKFALVIKNPQGAGAKTASDRFGYAVYFMLIGFFLLSFAAIADVYWFVRHIFKTDLDIVAQQKQESRGFGITNSINRRTFKKMLHYFEVKTGPEQQ